MARMSEPNAATTATSNPNRPAQSGEAPACAPDAPEAPATILVAALAVAPDAALDAMLRVEPVVGVDVKAA